MLNVVIMSWMRPHVPRGQRGQRGRPVRGGRRVRVGPRATSAATPAALATPARTAITAAVAVAATLGGLAAGPLPAASRAYADVVTVSQNTLRDGWDSSEPNLSPAVLKSGSFGQLFRTAVKGQVYAQPLVVGSTVIVVTQADWVYGLNSITGAVRWKLSLGTPWPTATVGCTDVKPQTGAMSTPVYDPATGLLYLVDEAIPAGSSAQHPAFFMHALDPATGKEQPGWPVRITGPPANDPSTPFNPYTQWQRAGLLLLGGSVYAGFGSHCDFGTYYGYVAGVNTATRAQTMWSDEVAGDGGFAAGIWLGGGGLMSDGAGRIFLATGNGTSPPAGPGNAPPTTLGDAVVRLGIGKDGVLAAKDFFSPADAPVLDTNDLDLGSGGPVGLPYGTASFPHLLVEGGKDGRLFLLNTHHLGGREQGPGQSDDAVSVAGPFGGEWGHPAAFGTTPTLTKANAGTADDFLYYVSGYGTMVALKFGLDSSGIPQFADVAGTSGMFGFGSGSPVVTSNGSSPSSAVVWEVYEAGENGANGRLEAYRAVPPASCTASAPCTLSELWSAPIGTAAKFTVPATDDGRVYVGTRGGHVLCFGVPAPLTGPAPVKFGDVKVGSTSAARDITVTATTTVTISRIGASTDGGPYQFSAGTPLLAGKPVSLPVTLRKGQKLTVPVRSHPTAPGSVTGALNIHTNATGYPVVSVSLAVTGIR